MLPRTSSLLSACTPLPSVPLPPPQILSWYPRLVVFPGFIDKARADHIIAIATKLLYPSGLAYRWGVARACVCMWGSGVSSRHCTGWGCTGPAGQAGGGMHSLGRPCASLRSKVALKHTDPYPRKCIGQGMHACKTGSGTISPPPSWAQCTHTHRQSTLDLPRPIHCPT